MLRKKVACIKAVDIIVSGCPHRFYKVPGTYRKQLGCIQLMVYL